MTDGYVRRMFEIKGTTDDLDLPKQLRPPAGAVPAEQMIKPASHNEIGEYAENASANRSAREHEPKSTSSPVNRFRQRIEQKLRDILTPRR